MDLLEQCRIWHENKEDEKVVEALEAVAPEGLDTDASFVLARSYNCLAANDLFDEETYLKGREELQRALELLLPLSHALSEDFEYNYETGFTYLYLEQEYASLPYLTKALQVAPKGDEEANADIQDLLGIAYDRMSIPTYQRSFRRRTKDAWDAFAKSDEALRTLMDQDADRDVVMKKTREILSFAFTDPSFELRIDKGRFALIFLPQGDRVRMFEYQYFADRAPEEVKKHWDIVVGRQPVQDVRFTFQNTAITPDDCLFWLEEMEEEHYRISLYCEKLQGAAEDKKWWFVSTLVDCVLGEIPSYRYLTKFEVLDRPKDDAGVKLSKLPETLEALGLDIDTDAKSYLQTLMVYGSTPASEDDDIWRDDVITGSTDCFPLIYDYMHGDYTRDEDLRKDGIAAGFFCYPLEYFPAEKRDEEIMHFRTELTDAVLDGAGPDAVTFTGGATGVDNGYLDFIAWDIDAVLDAARMFFARNKELPWIGFHAFRRDVRIAVIEDASDDGTHGDGIFTGSVLLSDPSWDRNQLLKDLRDIWDLTPHGKDEDAKDSLAFTLDDLFAVVRFVPTPISDHETEVAAQNNYLWSDAVQTAGAHKAYLAVAVIGTQKSRVESGKLFVKLMSACSHQKNCSAIYTNDVVVSPTFYSTCAKLLKSDELPILNWVWFGLYRSEKGISGFTHGMEDFGFRELEIENAPLEPAKVRSLLISVASCELEDGAALSDGTMIGLPGEGREIGWHEVHLAPGTTYPGQETLHIKVTAPDYSPFVLEQAEPGDTEALGREAVFLAWASAKGLLKEKLPNKDLMRYVSEDLQGILTSDLFNEPGFDFAAGYYRQDKEPYCLPSYLFDYALNRADTLPQVLENRYASFEGQMYYGGPDPDEAARRLMDQLPEGATYFPPMRDDDPLTAALEYTLAFKEKTKTPFFVCSGDGRTPAPDAIANPESGFLLYWDASENHTCPVILTTMETEYPWQVLTHFFEDPGKIDAARHFYEAYQAVPAVVASSGAEFLVPKPLSEETAKKEAALQKDLFPEMFEGIDLTSYVQYLTSARVWHFWWKKEAQQNTEKKSSKK